MNSGRLGASLSAYVPLVLLLLAFVGLFVMTYLATLRFNAVRYARTVNGVREYFTKRSGLSESDELVVRVLPRQTNIPTYLNRRGFLCIMATLALVNSVYCAAAVRLIVTHYCSQGSALELIATSIAFVVFAIGSLSIYYLLARSEAREPLPRDRHIPSAVKNSGGTAPEVKPDQDTFN